MRQLGKRINFALLIGSFFVLLLSPIYLKIPLDNSLAPISNKETIQVQPIIPRVAVQATNVCITEVYADGTAGEWFEIYNPQASPVDLTGWIAFDPSTGGEIIDLGGNISAYHGGMDTTIYAGEIITIGDSGAPAAIDIKLSTSTLLTLGDSADELAIRDNLGQYQDMVIWGTVATQFQNQWYWNTTQGAQAPQNAGESIERINATMGPGALEDNNNEKDWAWGTNPTPGTVPQFPFNATIGTLFITEVMYGGDGSEWIEIFNNENVPINISGCTLYSYADNNETIIPQSTILNPKTTYVVGEPLIYVNLQRNISLSDSGDVLMLKNNTGSNLDVVVWGSGNDTYTLGPDSGWVNSVNATGDLPVGSSIFRFLDSPNHFIDSNSSTDWNATSQPTPGSFPPYYQQPQSDNLLISEVMYAGQGNEWVEIFNNGSGYLNISQCILYSYSEDNQTVIPPSTFLLPHQSYVIGELSSPSVNLQRNISLEDSGDVLQLKNSLNEVLDTVCWGTGNNTFTLGVNNGWVDSQNATGNLPEGTSIFRYNLTRTILSDTNSSNDWYQTSNPTPGSFYSINVEDVLFSEIGLSEQFEFIELYNNLTWPVTLDGMEIWDYGGNNPEILFQGNVAIPARGVLTAGDSGGGYDYTNNITLTNSDEDLVLYTDVTRTYELDVIIYGNNPSGNKYPWGPGSGWIGPTNATGGLPEGTTLQRINSSNLELMDTNTSADWVAAARTNGTLPSYVPPAEANSVLITEVMFAPSSPVDGFEYVELYNMLDIPIDISGWQVYRGTHWGGTAEATFPIGTIIPAKTHFCLLDNIVNSSSRYNITGLYFSDKITLDDGPGDVILAESHDNIIDFVAWRSSTVNYTNLVDPIAWTDGGVYKGSAGKAIVRLYDPYDNDAYVDTNSSDDWRYSVYPNPGSHTNTTIFLSTPITASAQVTTFSSPDNSYSALVDLWRTAKTTLDICVYQFTSDPLLQELIAAMNRGVQVRLILQDIYPLYDSPYLVDSTHDSDNYQTVYAGTQVCNNPNGTVRWASSYFAYTHAKYFIIDGQVVGILTENFKSTGVPSNPTYGNRGWGIAINNTQLAQEYLQIYNFDWSIAQTFNPSSLITGQRDTFVPTGGYRSVGAYETFEVTAQFQTVVAFDDPINVIVNLLDSATKCIYIELFYLYPTWTGASGGQNNNPLLQALIRAAQRGVDIRVILDSTPYNLDGANNNDEAAQVLLAHGIQVKYSNNSGGIEKFHVKALIVDNASVMIASLNWNENSATNNREIGVIVNSAIISEYYVNLFFYDWVSLSTNTAPGGGNQGPEPTYTWLWWLPISLLVFIIVLLSGYVHRLSVQSTRVRNIPHEFSPSLKESIKPTAKSEKAPIHIELAILKLKIQEIYGSAINVIQLKPYGTATGETALATFIRSYVRANHEFLQVGSVVNPTPYTLIFKYSSEDYIGLESTLDLRPRSFEIKSLLTSAVRETVRLERIKARVDNMLREGY